jgi:hypothetical protein
VRVGYGREERSMQEVQGKHEFEGRSDSKRKGKQELTYEQDQSCAPRTKARTNWQKQAEHVESCSMNFCLFILFRFCCVGSLDLLWCGT